MPKSSTAQTVATILLALVLFVGIWYSLYPDGGDSHSVRCFLWKAGIYSADRTLAPFAMLGDRHREELIVGKTKEQLKSRFTLLTLDEVSHYYRDGHDAGGKDRDVLFIKGTPWMIVFEGDRATELILMKGY
jgi:hypothetical protein